MPRNTYIYRSVLSQPEEKKPDYSNVDQHTYYRLREAEALKQIFGTPSNRHINPY